MSNVIIYGLLMAGLLGLPIGLLFAVESDTWWGKMLAILISCGICFGFGCMCEQESVNDHETFNNGVCVKCGGEYRFTSSTRYRMSETFYYTCQDCGWTIETNCLMNKHQGGE